MHYMHSPSSLYNFAGDDVPAPVASKFVHFARRCMYALYSFYLNCTGKGVSWGLHQSGKIQMFMCGIQFIWEMEYSM